MDTLQRFFEFVHDYRRVLEGYNVEIRNSSNSQFTNKENAKFVELHQINSNKKKFLDQLVKIIDSRKVLTDFATLSDILYSSDFTDREIWEILLYFIDINSQKEISQTQGVIHCTCEICRNICSYLDEKGLAIQGKKEVLLTYLRNLGIDDRVLGIIDRTVSGNDLPQSDIAKKYILELEKIYQEYVCANDFNNLCKIVLYIDWFSYERSMSNNHIFLGFLNSMFLEKTFVNFSGEELVSLIIYILSRNVKSGLLKESSKQSTQIIEPIERTINKSAYSDKEGARFVYNYLTLIIRDELEVNAKDSVDNEMYSLFKTTISKFLRIKRAYGLLYKHLFERYNNWTKNDISRIEEALKALNIDRSILANILEYLNSKIKEEDTAIETSGISPSNSTPYAKRLSFSELKKAITSALQKAERIKSFSYSHFTKETDKEIERFTLPELIEDIKIFMQDGQEKQIQHIVEIANKHTLELLRKTRDFTLHAGVIDLDTLLINPWELYEEYKDKINYYASLDQSSAELKEAAKALHDTLEDIVVTNEDRTQGININYFCEFLYTALEQIGNKITYEKIQAGIINNPTAIPVH